MIFTTGIGTYASQSKVSKEFKCILRENDLPDFRFHDLRHTSISLLLDMGTPINTVQHRAGHSKASVTTDIYGHVMAHSQDAAAENIEQDIAQGYGSVELPFALACKYPNVDKEFGCQYIFPSGRLSTDPRSGTIRRHHLDPGGLQRAVRAAVKLAKID